MGQNAAFCLQKADGSKNCSYATMAQCDRPRRVTSAQVVRATCRPPLPGAPSQPGSGAAPSNPSGPRGSANPTNPK
jgi:hypothetical protein